MMISQNNIITGERLQQLADIYIGHHDNFYCNPVISCQKEKHISIDSDWMSRYSDPRVLFCYGHIIEEFSHLASRIQFPFILITHNSDQNMVWTSVSERIVNSPNLILWYAQNLEFIHEKAQFLPIGLANSMWSHGDLSFFTPLKISYGTPKERPNRDLRATLPINELKGNPPQEDCPISNLHRCKEGRLLPKKSKKTFMNFSIHTNSRIRQPCYDQLVGKISFLQNVTPYENLQRLSEYQFCICPEGNGFDTHRLWEALYLHVVPIVVAGQFTNILIAQGIPLVVLNSWSEYDENMLDYSAFDGRFDMDCLELDYYKNMIAL